MRGAAVSDVVELRLEPIAVDKKTAARMLDIGPTLFGNLVDEGRLPRPIVLHRRRVWAVAALRRAAEDESESANQFGKRRRPA